MPEKKEWPLVIRVLLWWVFAAAVIVGAYKVYESCSASIAADNAADKAREQRHQEALKSLDAIGDSMKALYKKEEQRLNKDIERMEKENERLEARTEKLRKALEGLERADDKKAKELQRR